MRINARGITIRQFVALISLLVIVIGIFFYGIHKGNRIPENDRGHKSYEGEVIKREPVESVVSSVETDTIAEVVEQEVYGDPNNSIYPFNTMSADWGEDLYESGFVFYQIPEEYVAGGGCFPEVVQAYLWYLCRDREIDYYTMVALIERESNYRYNARGDNGNSKGYMQVYEKWHIDRMAEEHCEDLYNPYGNVRVGTNFFQEIWDKYPEVNKALMVYNMGESKALKQWKKGILETEYTRNIIARAQEIKQELQD
nr:lytic transglycosylase domain-containing protein [uncultured Clostridium sp.]